LKVKICGITNYHDAKAALESGADALGFNFYRPSPRFVEPAIVREIVRALPPFAVCVGVFVNPGDVGKVETCAQLSGVQVIQLHGNETADFCHGLRHWQLIKAVRITGRPVFSDLAAYPVQAFLVDTPDEALFGGTGRVFDWSLVAGIQEIRPVILAGGLNVANVASAIRAVRPYGVDVCSGVEMKPGVKDPAKIARFLREVRSADQ